jgi:YVTN family beta-propeller protein
MKVVFLFSYRVVLLLACAATAFTMSGCFLFGPNNGTVFYIRSQGRLLPNAGCPPSGCTGYFAFPVTAPVSGQMTQASLNYPSPGTQSEYSGNTDLPDIAGGGNYGILEVNDPIVDADWSHEVWLATYCQTPPGAYAINYGSNLNEFEQDMVQMNNGDTFQWVCNTTQPPATGPAMSRFAYVGNIPSSIALPEIDQADPFSAAYGQPELSLYSGAQGVPGLYAQVTASSVASDGSSATFALPNSMPQGAYALVAANKTPSGGYSTNAYNAFIVASSTTVAGSPFGVAVAAQSTETINCVYVMEGPPGHQSMTTQCSESSSNPSIIPVVSLYSANQVMIGSSHVTVGVNPTAVATYSANAIINTVNNSNGYTTTVVSGSLRAIVANSGSNTVTILNTAAAAPVATVTVGKNPVALAVSADGTTGYVANYADSTVTEINLSTNTPTTTISVGGKPTSVALTSGGTLWVGGAGMLTQINASNMSVVGTETVPNRSIHALSYSNQYGQLIVHSTDTTGAVYQDEMAPAAFSAGGTYAAIASRKISTLGSYTIKSQNLKAFTSTLSTSSVLPITLPGAAPLVVQDGWVVIAATPTGFTITDISGHLVLVSQATPSPVAAIAVDPNLNIAYLTEPDSNTLLTVPLPGTN